MTLFEKIYFTLLIINIVLLILGGILQFSENGFVCYIGTILVYPFVSQFLLTLLYLIAKAILMIWGIELSWFPNVIIKE